MNGSDGMNVVARLLAFLGDQLSLPKKAFKWQFGRMDFNRSLTLISLALPAHHQ
jgi:hypothetical protein